MAQQTKNATMNIAQVQILTNYILSLIHVSVTWSSKKTAWSSLSERYDKIFSISCYNSLLDLSCFYVVFPHRRQLQVKGSKLKIKVLQQTSAASSFSLCSQWIQPCYTKRSPYSFPKSFFRKYERLHYMRLQTGSNILCDKTSNQIVFICIPAHI